MILETIKDQEYHKKILLANDSYAEIERKEGTQLIINVDYKGVYGLGEKFDAVNQKGKTVETQVIEKFCNQGNISYCVTPFFVTDSGLGIYIVILSILVDTFISKISFPMQPGPEIGSISDA